MDTVRICKSWWDRQQLAQTKLRVNQGSKKDYQQSDNPLLSLLKTHGSRDFLVVAVNRLSVYSQFFVEIRLFSRRKRPWRCCTHGAMNILGRRLGSALSPRTRGT